MSLEPAVAHSVGLLNNCDNIAFQHTNLVQPHAVLLNVDLFGYRILNASTNTLEILGLDFEEVWDHKFDDTLIPGIDQLRAKIENDNTTGYKPILDDSLFNCKGERILARVTKTSTRWLVELERFHHGSDLNACDWGVLQDAAVDLLHTAQSLDDLGSVIAKLQAYLNVDHCLLYRFDAEYNGEVIAEATSARNATRYLGLHFPARDVPQSARKMMLSVPLRIAVDQSLNCVAIHPRFDPSTQLDIDLTHVRSRGSVPSCQTFYTNLGVRSKLVLPLEVNGQLWGMINCHHHDALRISPEFDPYLKTIARLISYTIQRISQSHLRNAESRGRSAIQVLSTNSCSFEQSLQFLEEHLSDFQGLIPCTGFVLSIAGNVLSSGIVPQGAELNALLETLWREAEGNRIATNNLAARFPTLTLQSPQSCGVIALPIGTHRKDIAVWFRPEQLTEVHWAGCPTSEVRNNQKEDSYLSPRTSFEVWKSHSHGTCVAWTEEELVLADSAAMQLSLLVMGWYAAQASIDKNEFFACMSHELRTPLTAIMGYADLLSEEINQSVSVNSCGDHVETIRRNGVHLLRVIDDILDMAKIESGKLSVECIQFELKSLLVEVVRLMKARADEKRLRLSLHFETDVPKFIASNPVRLRQILLNLIGNGIKFTEVGAVEVRVFMDPSLPEHISFEIVDSGIGMTLAQQNRLFNAFSQAETSTTRRFGGSGLGLMISKNLSQLLGGDICVSSTPGAGSTFRVHVAAGSIDWTHVVRRESDVDLVSIPSPQTSPTKRSDLPRITGKKILLLEDGEDNQRLFAFMLERAGASVTIADNGRRGLEILTTDGSIDGPLRSPFPYDLILTDMQMPEMDGYVVARTLRDKGCRCPIIALTAFAMRSDAEKCFQAGCDDYLSKPLNQVDLLTKTRAWSDKGSGKSNSKLVVS